MTDPLRPGDPVELGGYQLLGRLGQGGMGSVYLGRGPGGRLAAVKVIRSEYASDPRFRGRFRSEVNRARQVPHFCTAEVIDADPDHPTPYLIVEYVDGPSLSQVIADQGPLAAGNLHSVAVGVATALAAIHGAGVIHRDLKPANVLFALGTPKVIDFGIARAFEATSQHTRTDQMVGTVAYMAPERFDTDHHTPVGPAADVFAWGIVVAYAGTGRTPFQADSPAATAARILTQQPNLDGLPAALQHVVARALAKDPVERPTAHELLDLLLDVDPAETTQVVRPELLRQAKAAQRIKPRNRVARRVVLASVLALALAGGGLLTAHSLSPRIRDALSAAPAAVRRSSSPPSSPAPARPTQRVLQGPSLFDRLDRPGQWRSYRDSGVGRCGFANDRLEAATDGSNWFACPGPTDTFAGDQSIAVDAAVLKKGSCAAVWFRKVDESGYLVLVCENEVRAVLDNEGEFAGEVKAAVPPTALGHARRIEINLTGAEGTVHVDGIQQLNFPVDEPSLAAGRVEIGPYHDDLEQGDTGVAFANMEVRTQ
ncbi:serine/threonine-protein kinase [Actinoplanes sp. NPDC049265]|uniref:serine/threonine-protein kinase n=1 Tax=Actinoplanes sp. NPDC049265 TaxID=3363902 RepID=UPI0037166097